MATAQWGHVASASRLMVDSPWLPLPGETESDELAAQIVHRTGLIGDEGLEPLDLRPQASDFPGEVCGAPGFATGGRPAAWKCDATRALQQNRFEVSIHGDSRSVRIIKVFGHAK